MSAPSDADAVGLYSGSSMLGTFVPGDKIETQESPFESMTAGDVILFSRDGKKIVHRIVGGSAETAWITRGDNNGSDDVFGVTKEEAPRLVIARIDLKGKRFPVLNGAPGLAHHRRLQRKLKRRRFLSRLIPQWCRSAPLRFLLPFREMTVASFGGLTVLYRGKMVVATRNGDGAWQFRRRWMRLFFSVPKGNE